MPEFGGKLELVTEVGGRADEIPDFSLPGPDPANPDFWATQFTVNVESDEQTAYFATGRSGRPIILPALGRARLRLYRADNQTNKFGAWTGYFTNSGDLGQASRIPNIAYDVLYDCMVAFQPHESVEDDWEYLSWVSIFEFTITIGGPDPPPHLGGGS